jgi:hypothetical protein
LKHSFFFDGNSKRIVWMIQTNDSSVEQKREHPNIYLNKVTTQQSKYIALHIGLFWGIGSFIFNNEDSITIKIDNKTMFDHLSRNENPSDGFINTRTFFITQLINQKKLKINYELVNSSKNLVSKSL